MNCPFCSLEPSRILLQNDCGVALRDGFPVSKGHALIVPRNHVASVFDLPAEEQQSLWKLVAEVRIMLDKDFHPDGFNIGTNDGNAAGQTVPHAHIHVIPRYSGDVPDPRGGIRWVLPDRAKYWK